MKWELSPADIQEIAEQIHSESKAWVHKQTGEVLFIPSETVMKYLDEEDNPWQEQIDQLNENITDYFEIRGMYSSDSYAVMSDFVDEVVDRQDAKERLRNALKKAKPFKQFKLELDYWGAYEDLWFKYKLARQVAWVTDQLERHGYGTDDSEEEG